MDNKIYQNKNSGDITDSQKNQSQTAEKSIQKTSAEVEKKPQKHSAEVGKSPQKHSAEIEKKRPKKNGPFKRAFLTALAVVLFRALCVFMRAKTDGKKLAKSIAEPCVLLSTHGSVFDAAYAGRAIVPKYYTGVVAKRLFYLPFLGKVLSYAEFIQKKQFVVDIGCIKQIKSGIDGGASVFICPEGNTSVVGRNSYLSPSIAKLIKWIGAPVLFYRAKGSYLSFPRFGKIRKGKILVESELLFGKDEIKNLSTDAIFERLNEAFQYNDHEYQEKNRIKFKCKAPAEGLELLLYKCPKCGAEFKNSSKKDEIFCSECGNTVKIDLYGKIVPIDISGERGVGKKEIISKTDENSNEKAVSNADGNSNEKIVSKIEANPNKIVSNSEIISNRSVAFDRIDRWVDFQKYALTAEIL
jgi:1-acyl-sn-glycerol-3-phosphate acyltransferase